MKEVILINYTGRRGGGPLDSYEMAKGLLNNGEQVVAIISKDIENLSLWEKLKLEKLIVIDTYNSYSSFIKHSILFYFNQRKIIKYQLSNYKVKVIYCPMNASWSNRINKIFKKSKIIVTIHDPVYHSGESVIIKLYSMLFNLNIIYKKADAIVIHSNKFMKYVETRYKKSGCVFYIPLGRHNIYSSFDNKKQSVNYEDNKINFLFFGRISKYKGLAILARAYKSVSKKRENISLTIAGNGDFSPYKDMYKELDNVRVFNKWIEDDEVEDYFIGNNIVMVCPYLDATQSGVIMIALDYGIPIIATDTGGISEQIQNRITGILIKPNSAQELEDSMIELIDNSALRSELSLNSKEYIKKFDWNSSAKELLDIIRKI